MALYSPYIRLQSSASRNPFGYSERLGVWEQLIRFDSTKVIPFLAFRNAAGVTILLAAGIAAGHPLLAIYCSLGALNASFSDGGDPYVRRGGRMLAASVLSALAVVVGALAGWHPLTAGMLIAVWALGAGLLVAISTAAADIGLLSLVMVLVFSGQSMPPHQALAAGLAAMLGGFFQTFLSVMLWPFRRYEPERRVIAALYSDLSAMASSPIRTSEAPPVSARVTEAREVVQSLGRTRTVQGDRYVSLVSQAERIRLNIVILRGAPFLKEVALITDAIARTLSGRQVQVDPGWLSAVQQDALAGQLRAAYELATSSTEAGRAAFEQRQSERPLRLRLENPLNILRANATLRSSAMRHAIRLSCAVVAGELVAHMAGGRRSYWLPMTAAIVLKPDFTTTFSRGALRIAGTFAGLAAATALFYLATPTAAFEVALISLIVFLLRCYGPANYGVFTAALTAYIVLLFALSGQPPGEVIRERGWLTLAGGALALSIYAVWPTWERRQIKETLAVMLDAYRSYFRAVHERAPDLEHIRLDGRLARSNAEASADRFATEPGTDAGAVTLLSQMMASSHRLIHAMMAIEASFMADCPRFPDYAHKVEITLHSLSAALRGSLLSAGALPDLRAAHNLLVESKHPLVTETDRLTNSLNTLSEQVLRFGESN